MNDNQPKILFLDIETSLVLNYSFGIRDQHITYKQIADPDRSARTIHCIGVKWAGERKVTILSEWEHGLRGMMERVHKLLCEADAVCTFNGAAFDMPKIEGQFALLDMELPPAPTNIDIYKTTRKWGMICNKLDYIAPRLGLGTKVKHDGMPLWIAVYEGCPKAQRTMARYCAGDVRLTEAVYNRVRPFMRNHPRLRSGGECSCCQSSNVQLRGFNYSKNFKTQRLFCLDCRAWSAGQRRAA